MKYGKKGAAKFFCEYCGAEVPQNAKVCKHCGRFFASVKCPQCGKTGAAAAFANGCPGCGYAAGKKHPAPEASAARLGERLGDSLPSWLYLVCALALIGLAGAFIFAFYG